MIAKAKSISHGCNAIRYALDKEKADVIRMNLLGQALDATAVWAQMLIHQQHCKGLYGQRRSLRNNAIRIEISPGRSDTVGWTRQDWEKLIDEYLEAFDSIDLSATTHEPNSKCTNLRNSQYVIALHHDSRGGIEHLHLIANRVDCNGHVIDDHMIHRRAMQAAAIVNAKRGWRQADDIREDKISQVCNDCLDALRSMARFNWGRYCEELMRRGYEIKLKRDNSGRVCGYTVKKGNTTYKSSEIGPGRHLMPSKIEQTWWQLHGIQDKYNDYEGSIKGSTIPDVERVHRPMVIHQIRDMFNTINIPVSADISNLITNEIAAGGDEDICQVDVVNIAVALFVGMIAAATDMSCSCGGGGSAPSSDWGRNPDEDDKEWARRCARMALQMAHPRRRGLRR